MNVKVADLKARLSEYLRQVKRGHTITVVSRDIPVARLVPYPVEADPLRTREPRRRVPSIHDVPLPPPLKLDIDVVELLIEDRKGRP